MKSHRSDMPDILPPLPLYNRATLQRVEHQHKDDALMQRAAVAAAEWASQLRAGRENDPILFLAGPGNNGGDAITCATLLRRAGVPVVAVFTGRGRPLPPDADAACQQFIAAGGKFLVDIPPHTGWSLIVDGLFGIGLSKPPQDEYARLIVEINRLAHEQGCPILALDCPSGLDADTGFAHPPTVDATHTLTFIAAKPGLYTADGPDHCGEIRIADLDLDISAQAPKESAFFPPDGHTLEVAAFAHCLAPRRANTHKGSYGNVGILGGATAMQGAVLLAGHAALKLGAGKVFVGMLDAKSVDYTQPELMLRQAPRIFDIHLQALVCGPGMGLVGQARDLLPRALAAQTPLLLDADALTLLTIIPSLTQRLESQIRQRREQGFPTLLTPHPAEAARLLATTPLAIQENRLESARELARRFQAWVVLKGCGSIVSSPEGRWWINRSGNPGMAGPGFGDTLTGFIAALLGQGWPAGEALLAAVHLHGKAADDLVAAGVGPVGLTASEIIDAARLRFNRWLRRDFT
ncbi:MAG: NAD(P)H-hydrate dehydratase [Zoogloeaceae bacterium]|jgi:hydroxyethylthiazole kinase-like uncharacterized protein yjeF|nr:NAD(P)H-hydrate dehydratase [Zoogloeaceae bacterium]